MFLGAFMCAYSKNELFCEYAVYFSCYINGCSCSVDSFLNTILNSICVLHLLLRDINMSKHEFKLNSSSGVSKGGGPGGAMAPQKFFWPLHSHQVYVVLIHNRQASNTLTALADEKYVFDEFIADIPSRPIPVVSSY